MIYRIAGNFRRRKLARILQFFWLFAKVFSTKLGGVVSFGAAQVSNLQKIFSMNIVFFTNLQKFSPLKISRYAVAKGVLGWAMVGIGDGKA